MANKFLDSNGLVYLWSQLKAKFENKVDKETGKGLSTNDYTNAEKTKLGGIEEGANKTIIEDVLTSTNAGNALSAAQGKALKDQIDEVENSLGELGYGDMMKSVYDTDGDGVVDNAAQLGGHDPEYFGTAEAVNQKLDKTGDGKDVTVTFTQAASRVNIATGEKLSSVLGKVAKYFADLKTVAFTGSYKDLTDKPEIPVVTNDLTNELKAQYDAAYTHSQADHAPVNAQENVIEGVQVNGTDVTLTGKKANITVPTTVAQLTDATDYAKKADIVNVYKYKGSVGTVSALPAEGNTAGDVYNVEERGINYAWDGSKWDALGEVFEVATITTAEIDTILAS